MRRAAVALLILGLMAVACGSATVEPPPNGSEPRDAAGAPSESEAPSARPAELGSRITLSAAGVELGLPPGWELVDEDEPSFAMAWAPQREPSEVPMCTIELRRQGAGPLPKGVKVIPSSAEDTLDYSRGGLRGRVRELPGPTPSSSVIVHCRAPRAARQWAAIELAFDSIEVRRDPYDRVPKLPPLVGDDAAIVELCTGTPARRTLVCARRRDGAVFCGPSSGEVLTQVEGLPPAIQLSCDRARSCARDVSGRVSCWQAKQAGSEQVPEQLSSLGRARDLAGACVVDERGKVWCHRREPDDSRGDALVELLPLGIAAYALTEVERVLEGSDENHGCVLRDGGKLWCWDLDGELPLALAEDRHPQLVKTLALALALALAPAPADDLALWGGRVCVAGPEQWTCIEYQERWVLDGCERRACGCSLIGATRLSCDHEPHERIDTRTLGRVGDVVAVAGPCAARRDGVVVCRGPVTGRSSDDPRVIEAVAGGLPGVAHLLELREVDRRGEQDKSSEPAPAPAPAAPL